MAAIFFSWWLRQLVGLLPAAWRPAVGAVAAETGDSIMLTLETSGSPTLDAARRRGKRLLQLGRFTLDAAGLASLRAAIGGGRAGSSRGPIRLLLPPALLLEQPVSLPLQAERGLETALRWEMDRLTPFPAEAVFWTWRIVQRDRARGQLDLRLMLVAKAAIQDSLDALAAVGLAPARLEAAGEPGRVIPLSGRRAAPRRPALLAGVVVCIGLAIAAAVLPFARQQTELERLEARVAEYRPQVDVADALRRRIADRAASIDVVAAEAARVGNTLQALAVLTDLLPDDTSLYELAIRDRVLTFTGQSTQAARLIAVLAADPTIRNPVFAAPVTRNELTRAEAFSIRAEIRP